MLNFKTEKQGNLNKYWPGKGLKGSNVNKTYLASPVKGILSIILRDPSCKDGIARLITVTLFTRLKSDLFW